MDKDNVELIKLSGPGGDSYLHYPKMYTPRDFVDRYGEDDCTIMLQDRERELYTKKAVELANQLQGEADWEVNAQAALDAWNPCDDRPPTETELLAKTILLLPEAEQAALYRHVEAGILAAQEVADAKAAEVRKARAEEAAAEEAAMKKKFAAQDDIGAPVTTPQQEPEPPASFEAIGQEQDQANSQAVQAAVETQTSDVAANETDFTAPTEFEEGGTGEEP